MWYNTGMKIKQNAVEFVLENTPVRVEAQAEQGMVRATLHGARAHSEFLDVRDEGRAYEAASWLIVRVTGKPAGRCATNSEVRDLADLLRAVAR